MSKGMGTKKLNNNGFSLLEVLIAMVILALVSIPLLHSFVTTAKTNGRAKILMRATDCAENLMESLEYRSVEGIVEYYKNSGNTVYDNWGMKRWEQLKANQTVDGDESEGAYVIDITNPSDISQPLPDGYKVYMLLDPNMYPNNNALNVADVKSISIEDTAVYEMSQLYDESVYNRFDEWNRMANEDQNVLYTRKSPSYFKENLSRTMEITIEKLGTDVDGAGNTVDLVKVKMDIKYYFKSKSQYQSVLPSDRKEYVEETKVLFNNLSTKVPLNGIYVFYQPRYLANKEGNRDTIIINNVDNLPVNIMLAAQQGAADASYKSQYFNALTGPNVTVIENPAGSFADADAGVTLFTNLTSTAPYSAIAADGSTVENGKVLCKLVYQNPAGTQKLIGEDAIKRLDVRNTDGKTLIADNVKERIYKVAVMVTDQQGELFLELDGTKLE